MKTHHPFLRLCFIASSAIVLFAGLPVSAQVLGTAGSYGVLGSTTVTNTGNTVISGDLGVSPGLAITGFSAIDGGPGLFSGALNQGNAAAAQARADLTTAYTTLAGLAFTADLSGQDLGGLTLTPGVYRFSSSAQLTGTLILNAGGNNNARFVFQIGSTLTTASNSAVSFINLSLSDECGPDNGLFWQIGSSATIGTDSLFAGNILALTSITLNNGASIDYGRALARNGAVTLDSNRIDASDADGGFCVSDNPGGPGGMTAVPEPSTYGMIGACLLIFAVWRRRAANR